MITRTQQKLNTLATLLGAVMHERCQAGLLKRKVADLEAERDAAIADRRDAEADIVTQVQVIADLRARLDAYDAAFGFIAISGVSDDGAAITWTATGDARRVIVEAVVAARKAAEVRR